MNTLSGKQLSKIGIGTYGVGGRGHRNMAVTEKEQDQVYVDSLSYTLEHGSNFTEISLGYGHGHSLELFKQALDSSSISREDVFITHSFYPNDITEFSTIAQDTKKFYDVMQTDYADSILVTQSLILKFGEDRIFEWLHGLLGSGQTRYVSLSNASPTWIKRFKEEFGDHFFAHEGHFSFEVRVLQDKGVFDTCNKLGVANIIWRPLRRNASLQQNWESLVKLSQKYNKTQGQIILNWMCHLGYMPMVFSTNIDHVDENLSSTDFVMDDTDYTELSNYRLATKNLPSIDWEGEGIDNDIVGLVKDIETYL